jgi:3-isopropylmalate/(R)-2-methylmalate dehydratase small subunit
MSGMPLTRLTGTVAVMRQPNIDTDIISPVLRREGKGPLGFVANGADRIFSAWRYDAEGRERPDFVLNRPPFRDARFILAGANFACGSSRETAALWLRDFGIRCVLAPSFSEIFYDNCFRNGILPLMLDQAVLDQLAPMAEAGEAFTVDIEAEQLQPPGGAPIDFKLPAFRRELLITGADEVDLTLAQSARIAGYQEEAKRRTPWIWPA